MSRSRRKRGAKAEQPQPTTWPTRDAWLAAGFVSYRTPECLILIAPSLLPKGYCKRCVGSRKKKRGAE